FLIRGTVRNASLAGLPNVFVDAFHGGGASCCSSGGYGSTDASGNFSFAVPNGTYRIEFFPPSWSRYLSQWWNGATSFATATDVVVSGADVPNINATLTAASGGTTCTSVALTPSPSSPQTVGTTVLWTASASGCSSPQYLFYVRTAGVWAIAQNWSTSATFSWNTTGLAAGDYLVEVDARNGSSGSFQSYIDSPEDHTAARR